ncbi:MAG: DUF3576 domain-containing protein [Alphaproteobacteria bacterium]
MNLHHNFYKGFALACALSFISACNGLPQGKAEYPDQLAEKYEATGGSMLGSPGFKLFDDQQQEAPTGSGGLAVNAYLWRATLDTLSFMPMMQVDAFGGVIITDWHSQGDHLDERLKINAYILGRELRANGIRVSVFRQVKDENGEWIDAEVTSDVATKLEDAILTKARQLRIASSAPQK